ncbi:hypothetical protein A9K55_006856 [Cordyceps militaris]|uniref:Uncharacterized protein n=1 Tax=Cordyceps militaris TaxID=73501 RepID=A0A2H4SCN1_CORMI|nr:hypothetical protein A9K55_006856 [Cordyceps militaris]
MSTISHPHKRSTARHVTDTQYLSVQHTCSTIILVSIYNSVTIARSTTSTCLPTCLPPVSRALGLELSACHNHWYKKFPPLQPIHILHRHAMQYATTQLHARKPCTMDHGLSLPTSQSILVHPTHAASSPTPSSVTEKSNRLRPNSQRNRHLQLVGAKCHQVLRNSSFRQEEAVGRLHPLSPLAHATTYCFHPPNDYFDSDFFAFGYFLFLPSRPIMYLHPADSLAPGSSPDSSGPAVQPKTWLAASSLRLANYSMSNQLLSRLTSRINGMFHFSFQQKSTRPPALLVHQPRRLVHCSTWHAIAHQRSQYFAICPLALQPLRLCRFRFRPPPLQNRPSCKSAVAPNNNTSGPVGLHKTCQACQHFHRPANGTTARCSPHFKAPPLQSRSSLVTPQLQGIACVLGLEHHFLRVLISGFTYMHSDPSFAVPLWPSQPCEHRRTETARHTSSQASYRGKWTVSPYQYTTTHGGKQLFEDPCFQQQGPWSRESVCSLPASFPAGLSLSNNNQFKSMNKLVGQPVAKPTPPLVMYGAHYRLLHACVGTYIDMCTPGDCMIWLRDYVRTTFAAIDRQDNHHANVANAAPTTFLAFTPETVITSRLADVLAAVSPFHTTNLKYHRFKERMGEKSQERRVEMRDKST